MNRTVGLALAVMGAGALAGQARADDEWRTVALDGGVRIDVPVVVGDQYKSSAAQLASGDLMGFVLTTDASGSLSCSLIRYAYHQPPITPLGQAEMTTIVTSTRRDGLCDGGTAVEVMLSRSATSREGYPAADCVAAKTEAGDAKTPGRVESVEGIAAPGGFYTLSCTVYAATRKAALNVWFDRWAGEIDHVETSLRLP